MSSDKSLKETEARLCELVKMVQEKQPDALRHVLRISIYACNGDYIEVAKQQNIQIAACRVYIGELHRRIDDAGFCSVVVIWIDPMVIYERRSSGFSLSCRSVVRIRVFRALMPTR